MATGNPTQAIQTNFGQIAQQGVAQVQQAQALEDQRKEAKYKKMQDLEDRYGIPAEDFMLEDTEFRTLNDVQTEAMSGARDKYYDVFKKLEQDPTNVGLKKQLSRIKGSVGAIQSTHEKFMALGEEYVTKMENDEISGVDEDDLFEKLQAVEKGRYKIRWDDNDRLQVITYDEKGEISDTLNYKELINRDVISKVKVDEDLDKLMERIGEDNLTTAQGGRLVTTNAFGARQEQAAMEHIDSVLGTNEASLNENNALADLLYQQSNGKIKKRGNFTEDERQQVKEWMMNKVRGRYDNKVTMAGDPVWNQRQANANRSNRSLTKAEMEAPDSKKLSVSTIGGDTNEPLMRDGKMLFNYNGAIQLDAAKTSTRYDGIQYGADGQIEIIGQKLIKEKGIQTVDDEAVVQKTREEIATKNKVSLGSVVAEYIADKAGNKMVTYYVEKPDVTSDPQLVSKYGNILNLGDYKGVQEYLDNLIINKYDQTTLDNFKAGKTNTKENTAIPEDRKKVAQATIEAAIEAARNKNKG
tara:strand:- start:5944 stop:7518 length:1575 start_codon:yes stop_codon:yes gene_type:complete